MKRLPFAVAVGLVLLVAAAFRIVALDRVPGINGDEAYYPVAMMNVRDGHAQSLTTGSGLPFNPLYAIPVYLLHAGHPEPAFTLVRLTAVLSGLLTLALAYPLLARATGRRTALYTLLLLACLPSAIAYSRFGWDQSQTPLVSLACLYFALRRQPLGLALAYGLALWVHPMNVFLGPVLLGPIAADDFLRRRNRPATEWAKHLRIFTIGVAAITTTAGGMLLLTDVATADRVRESLSEVVARTIDMPGWLRFAVLTGDFLGGVTIYRYLAGEPSFGWIAAERTLFWTLVPALLLVVVPRWWRRRDADRLGLLGGLLATLPAYYALVGYAGVSPGFERYSMWLVTPACVVAALLLADTGESGTARSRQCAGLLAVCTFLLVGFQANYFQVFAVSGGDSERAFRTGPIEPKQAALEAIRASAQGEPLVSILAEDWWAYHPIRYLSFERPDLHVFLRERNDGGEADLSIRQRRFAVGFAGGPFERWIAGAARPAWPRQSFADAAGRPVLHVWDLGYDAEGVAALLDAAADEDEP